MLLQMALPCSFYCWVIFQCVYIPHILNPIIHTHTHIFFIHLSVDGHLGCFHERHVCLIDPTLPHRLTNSFVQISKEKRKYFLLWLNMTQMELITFSLKSVPLSSNNPIYVRHQALTIWMLMFLSCTLYHHCHCSRQASPLPRQLQFTWRQFHTNLAGPKTIFDKAIRDFYTMCN